MPLDKQKLKSCFQQIEKQHGPGTIFKLGSSRRLAVEVLPTGVLPVDLASGVGGIPRGRTIEIFGPPSGGKTTLTLQLIAQAQRAGEAAAFIDAEHALDPKYAEALGVDVSNLIVSQPDNGEMALEVAEALIRSEQFGVIVVDSVAALVPKKELEGEMGDAQMGLQARLMSQAMRKINGVVARTRTCMCFINQTRNKIGVMYGNPETTTGGEALKFYASMRITVRPGQLIKNGDVATGCQSKIKFIKNKVAAPFKEAEVEQVFGRGFEKAANAFLGGLSTGVIEKNGSHYLFAGEEIANGKEAAVDTLREDPLLTERIISEALLKAFPPAVPVADEQEAQAE